MADHTITSSQDSKTSNQSNSENSSPINKLNSETSNTGSEQKHRLQHRWGLWYESPPDTKKTYSNYNTEKKFKKIIDFSTVEDFWCLFNNILQPSELAVDSNYQLMKDGFLPEWENVTNGGHWILTLEIKDKPEIDKLWQALVLDCIGEAFEYGNNIVGAVVSIRRQRAKLELWTKDATTDEICLRIGNDMKKGLATHNKIIYFTFDYQIKNSDKNGKVKKPRHEIS